MSIHCQKKIQGMEKRFEGVIAENFLELKKKITTHKYLLFKKKEGGGRKC